MKDDEDLETRVMASVKTWSQAMYGTIHALRLMRAVDLGNLKKLGFSMQESMGWVESKTGFSGGVWNERCIEDLPGGGEKPAVGDVLAVGFGDVLRYKRAVRTLLNEALKIN